MDEFLAIVGVQAMRYAVRSGLVLTSTYCVKQCSRLLKSVDDSEHTSELRSLQNRLESETKVILHYLQTVDT